MSTMTLTVDLAARPIGLMPVKDAVARLAESMISGVERAQALISNDERTFRSKYVEIPAPVVLMVDAEPKDWTELLPAEMGRVSSRVLFARDRYACQYCDFVATSGNAAKQLTVDHVKPAHLFASRAEATFWENCTTACRSCNQAKGGQLPMEFGKLPRITPTQPHYVQLRFAGRLSPAQRSYVRDYFSLGTETGL